MPLVLKPPLSSRLALGSLERDLANQVGSDDFAGLVTVVDALSAIVEQQQPPRVRPEGPGGTSLRGRAASTSGSRRRPVAS